MEKETRNAIQNATQKARRLLEADFAEQLEGVFDIILDGRVGVTGGAHLTGRQNLQRDRIIAAIEHKRAAGMEPDEAVLDYLRDAAFTALNRFVALKMLEARDLVQECITRGDTSSGFTEFCGLAPGVRFPDGSGYRLYLECIFDELSTEVKVLFDRRDPASVLWPSRGTLDALLAILNAQDLAGVWAEDETIGWVYQYFNGQDERRKMRDESPAPRNSRELAVRNQFFTPRYVVQFLTENTLGRIWYEMRDGNSQITQCCEYLVRRPDETWEPRPKKDPRDLKILDPACGSGHFLLYCFDLLVVIYEEAWADPASPKCEITGHTMREDYPQMADLRAAMPGLILGHNLHGVDIDPRCAQIGQLALWMRSQRAFNDFGIARAERSLIRRSNIVIAEPMPGEKELLAEFLRDLREDRLEGLLRRAFNIPPERTVKATRAMADSLAQLVATVWEGLRLAGEMGTLLKIERDLARAIELGREEWEDRLPLFRVAEYGFGGATKETLMRVVPGEHEDFWAKAEKLVLQALADYGAASGADGARRRLFTEDAGQGFALADLLSKRFDVALMNPPFGDATPAGLDYLEDNYHETRLDLFSSFVIRLLDLANEDGLVGALTPRDGFFKKTLSGWRELVLQNHMSVVADLGIGVLDSATVRVAAYVIARRQSHLPTRFIDLVDVIDRDTRLKEEVALPRRVHDIQMSSFTNLPLSRFLYWLPPRLWQIFTSEDPLENRACTPRYGLTTLNDERFCRLSFEIAPATVGPTRTWVFMSKGGDDFPYGGVSNSLVRWKDNAAEMGEVNRQANGQIAQTRRASKYYFRPAITFSNRSVQFFGRWHPANFVFSVRGPAVIPLAASQAYLLGFFNSRFIRALIQMQTASQTYTSGVLKELRWVEPDSVTRAVVEGAAREAFEQVRNALATVETDPVFEGLLSISNGPIPRTVQEYFTWRDEFVEKVNATLVNLQRTIDAAIAGVYGVSMSDIERCERMEDDEEMPTVFPPAFRFSSSGAEALMSYLFGVAVRRWEPRVARQIPSLNDIAPETPPAASINADIVAIACDDPGHPHDIVSVVRRALEQVFPDEAAHSDISSLEEALGNNVREWLGRSFFSRHVADYSGFGRRAPIYWQLATPSASYSVWLYIHAFTKDTLYRVQNDYVAPKLSHEERRLDGLHAEARPNPNSGQRRAIEMQEVFVDELRTFFDEVQRVAPLWNPDLDDGVIINSAPLWRLVPQHRTWQKELRTTWEALANGDYDWAHLAMHLWPERVVPKCATDRSLAIAHGLEGTFWFEDDNGKWKARDTPARPIDELVAERTSPAVKAALKSLVEAPDPTAAARRSRNGKGR